MGIPSLSIVFHEVLKMLHYAECTDVKFFRLGTSGGLGKYCTVNSKFKVETHFIQNNRHYFKYFVNYCISSPLSCFNTLYLYEQEK